MASISLRVKSNFDEAGKDIRKIGDLTEREAKRIARFNKSFKSDQINSFIQKNERAAAAVRATRGPLDALQTKNAGLRREIERLIRNGMDPQDDALRKLQKEYDKTSRRIDANTRAQKAMGDAARVATRSLIAMGTASAAIVYKSSKAWADYSKSLANVNTMIDISQDEFALLDKNVTSLSNKFAIQKKELAGGVYQALSAGASNLGEALEIVEASAKLGKGALIENSAAVDIVTTAMNAYGKETVSASEAIDTYFTIIKKGKINGEQLSQTIGQSISLFAAAKIPLKELGAGVATLTKVGVQSSEATTQLNAVVNAFLKPSKKMTESLKSMGYASGGAFLEAEGLAGVMDFLATAGDGTIDSMSELVPNIRGLRGALALASENGMVFNEVLEAFQNQSGAADEALKRQTDGFAKDAFTVEQSKIAFQNLGLELGKKLIPTFGVMAAKMTAFIMDGQRLKRTLDVILPVLAGITTGLASFLIIGKVASIIQSFSKTMSVLNAVMAANPAIFIAAGIAVAIAAIVLLIRNWDKVVIFIQTTVTKLQQRMGQFAGWLDMFWTRAFQNIKIIVISLAQTIIDRLLGAVQKFLELAGRLPFVGDKFKGLAADVAGMRASLESAKHEAVNGMRAKIAAVEAEKAALRATTESNIAGINREAAARRAALKEQEQASSAFTAGIKSGSILPDVAASTAGSSESISSNTGSAEVAPLKDRLAVLDNIEAVSQQERLVTFGKFLSSRMEQEGTASEARIEFLQNELARIQELETLSNQEKLDAEKAVQAELTRIQQEQMAIRWQAAEATLGHTQNMFESLIQVSKNAGKESRALVIMQRTLAVAQIGIDTARGVMKTLAEFGMPWGLIPAAAMSAAGAAQIAAVVSTPIPAETGGHFIIPENPSSSRGDSQLMRLNPGEEVSVNPRGESSGSTTVYNFKVNQETIWSVVQKGIDSGEITISDDNLRAG